MPTISDNQALAILRESSNKALDAQGKANVASLSSVVAAKSSIARATADSAKGDQYSAISKMAAGGLGTLLNTKLNIQANQGMSAKDLSASPEKAARKQAGNAGLNAATQGGGVANLVQSAGDAIDQNAGFAKQSSDAKIAQKGAEIAETIANQGAESSKANKEKAARGVDAAEEFGKGIQERIKQVFDRLF